MTDLVDKVHLSLKIQVELGEQLMFENPEIAQWREEKYFSYARIARLLGKQNNSVLAKAKTRDVSKGAVMYALGGNQDPQLGNIYDGLLGKYRNQEISKITRSKSGKKRAIKSRYNQEGIFNLTEAQKREGFRNSAIARGMTPWDDKHLTDAQILKQNGYTHKEIAEEMNKRYHKGEPIRTKNSVDCMFRREKINREKRDNNYLE